VKRGECAVGDGVVSVVVVKRTTTQGEDERANLLEISMTVREVFRRRPLALSWESIGYWVVTVVDVWFGLVRFVGVTYMCIT
jgi:hypothetical protein